MSSLPRSAALWAVAIVLLLPAAPAHAEPAGPSLRGPGVVVGAGALTPPPDVAPSWLVADVGSGKVLAAKGAHQPRPPASVLKALTAVALLPELDPAAVRTATVADAAQEGSKVGMVPGATYTVADLWRGLILPSGNDAAHALGEAVGGQERAVALMTAAAQRLGATDTVVANTSGLDAPGQVSTAYDLALITRAGLDRADFRELVSMRVADFPGAPAAAGGARASYKIYTQNRLLRNGYDGAIGVKTGSTTLAKRTFIGAAERDGRTLLVVTLGSTGRPEPAAAELLDWGFANGEVVQPAGILSDPTVTSESTSPVSETSPVAGTSLVTAPANSSGSPIAGSVLLTAGLLTIGLGLLIGRRADRSPEARLRRRGGTAVADPQ